MTWRTDRYDEHGIPRCRHCGGEGNQDMPGTGLFFTPRGEPMIRYRCAAPWFPQCAETQRIACSEEWLMLLPLSRKTELYHAIAWAHSNKEHVFRHMRDRYSVGGSDVTSRLRRPGVPPQRLRAWAALLLDWFRLCLRQRWLEPVELEVAVNAQEVERLSGIQDRSTGQLVQVGRGAQRLAKLMEDRAGDGGAEVPYGPAYERATALMEAHQS